MRRWAGEGPEFRIDWGDDGWTLRADAPHPGLYRADGAGPWLGLDGVAAAGRWEPQALSGASLVGLECHLGRVEATFQPPDWGEMTVRAAWSPVGDRGIDLEVQLSAQSVGVLRAVEVLVRSAWPGAEEAHQPLARWVEPRDARAAGLSYDGREPDLSGLTTLPPREAAFRSPRIVSEGDALYVEMVHPSDVSRRIREGGRTLAQARTTRYALFGHDLERGIVLRGRLRGYWLTSPDEKPEALRLFEAFLAEPPPLGP